MNLVGSVVTGFVVLAVDKGHWHQNFQMLHPVC